MTKELSFLVNQSQEEDFSIYESGTTQRRIGPYHGNKYIATPRAFVRHRWIFRDVLGLLGCNIFEVLFSYVGDDGLFPSYATIADNLGITDNVVYLEIKKLTQSILTCPLCGYKQLIIRKKNRKKGKQFLSSEYSIYPMLDFLQHIDEIHYLKENEKYQEALEAYKLTRSKKKTDF